MPSTMAKSILDTFHASSKQCFWSILMDVCSAIVTYPRARALNVSQLISFAHSCSFFCVCCSFVSWHRLQTLLSKFDEIANKGEIVCSTSSAATTSSSSSSSLSTPASHHRNGKSLETDHTSLFVFAVRTFIHSSSQYLSIYSHLGACFDLVVLREGRVWFWFTTITCPWIPLSLPGA